MRFEPRTGRVSPRQGSGITATSVMEKVVAVIPDPRAARSLRFSPIVSLERLTDIIRQGKRSQRLQVWTAHFHVMHE